MPIYSNVQQSTVIWDLQWLNNQLLELIQW